MTNQEREALKAELMQELREEMNTIRINGESAKALQPILDKWCNGENRNGNHYGRNGELIEVLPKYKGWNTWEHIRRITCNIMNVSYVRDIKDVKRARHIANSLCELITKLAKEEQV